METKAPDGYLIDDIPKDFQITDNQKVDAVNGDALPGAVFEIRKKNGAARAV